MVSDTTLAPMTKPASQYRTDIKYHYWCISSLKQGHALKKEGLLDICFCLFTQ